MDQFVQTKTDGQKKFCVHLWAHFIAQLTCLTETEPETVSS